MTKKFERTVIEQIRTYELINGGENVIVGVSGGMDSVCLLHILKKLSEEWGFNIFAVHVNHMLRGEESERDKRFVKDLCLQMKVPCMAVNTDVAAIASQRKLSLEEAGRVARYKAFEAAAVKVYGKDNYAGTKVAVAHHRDDNVETVLLNLSRGAGLNGLKGILPSNKNGNLQVIRPLLGVGRADIEEYINENKLSYVTDSTNSSDDYARNKIRLNVIPELQKVNSRVLEHIGDTASEFVQIQDYMEKQIEAAIYNVVDFRDDSVAISADNLMDKDPAIRTGIVYRCIGKMSGTLKDITRVNVHDVISLADKQTGRRIELPYGLLAYRSYENIIIKKEIPGEGRKRRDYEEKPVHMTLGNHINISLKEIGDKGKTFILADGGKLEFRIVNVDDSNRAALTEKNIYKKAFDCDTIKGSLILGRPMPDDDIKFAGGSKSLRKYFTDEKIPWEVRNQLIVLKDLNSTLWVLGYRIGEPYKVTKRTTRALVVTITGGKNE